MGYVQRLADSRIEELFSELSALMLSGPRACGKSTTASRYAKSIARLDIPNQRRAVQDDPDAVIRAFEEPLLIDEWQLAPEVLGALKRAIDADPRPGRFLLTGSSRARLTAPIWPGTGRVTEIRMSGLTQRELTGAHAGEGFLRRLSSADLDKFPIKQDAPDLTEYIRIALRGGFPDSALSPSDSASNAWLDGYVEQLITRDADLLGENRDPERLRGYLEALCLNSGGSPSQTTLYGAAGINARTATGYDNLLSNLYMLDSVPAWSANRLQRLVKRRKLFLADPAIIGAVLNLDVTAVVGDSDLAGRLVETFVVSQIRAEARLESRGFRLHHLREKGGGREIDLLAEGPGGYVVALEIKATANPRRNHANHLIWLRDQLGDRFLAGAVLHSGPFPLELDEKIFALPIYGLWS